MVHLNIICKSFGTQLGIIRGAFNTVWESFGNHLEIICI